MPGTLFSGIWPQISGFGDEKVYGPLVGGWLKKQEIDEIGYNEFCRRGQKQQTSGAACAGMPETRHGAISQAG